MKTKTHKQQSLSYTPTESLRHFNLNQFDDEACNPHHSSQNTLSEESEDETMPTYTNGEGEGQ